MERELEHFFDTKLDELKNELKTEIINKLVEAFYSPDDIEIPPGGMDLDKHMNMIEKTLLLKALERSEESRIKAARLLNISLDSLKYRLQKHRI